MTPINYKMGNIILHKIENKMLNQLSWSDSLNKLWDWFDCGVLSTKEAVERSIKDIIDEEY